MSPSSSNGVNTPRKAFYSCLDAGFIREAPQPLQHLAIGKMAEQAGGQIVYYTTEDGYTRATHEVILARLKTSSQVDGVVFFRLAQFACGGRVQAGIMRDLVEQNYELHFARERISIRTLAQAEDACRKLHVLDWTERRGRMLLQTHEYL
jgi:hypothetical protein